MIIVLTFDELWDDIEDNLREQIQGDVLILINEHIWDAVSTSVSVNIRYELTRNIINANTNDQ